MDVLHELAVIHHRHRCGSRGALGKFQDFADHLVDALNLLADTLGVFLPRFPASCQAN